MVKWNLMQNTSQALSYFIITASLQLWSHCPDEEIDNGDSEQEMRNS